MNCQAIHLGKNNLFEMMLEQLDYHTQKKKKWANPYDTSETEINLKWVTDTNLIV